jgi:hypothetical protein
MHSIEYTYCSPYLSNIWTKNQGRNAGIYLCNAHEYTIPPAPRKEFFRRFSFYSFPTTWNNLGVVKLQHNRTTFCMALQYKLYQELLG